MSKKNFKKKFQKKISKKNSQNQKTFMPKLLKACNRGSACEKLGGLCLLVWEEIENAQTVVKGLAKLLYRLQKYKMSHLFD
jgi:hypothetical protein